MPSILLQRDIQRVDRFQIEVVGGLVEHQHVGLLQHQPAENAAAPLRRPESASVGFSASSPLKSIWPEQAAQFLLRRLGSNWCSHSIAVDALLDGFGVVLREVTDGHFVAPATRCRRRSGIAGLDRSMKPGAIANQRLQQRGLAGAVAAHERDLFAARHARGERLNHFHAVVRLRDALDFERMPARRAGSSQTGCRAARCSICASSDGLQPLHFFLARRHLR